MDASQRRFVEIVGTYAELTNRIRAEPVGSAVDILTDACARAPDDEHLLVLAVVAVDLLLDLRWREAKEPFIAAMRRSSALRRKAWSGAMPDIPQLDIDYLDNLLGPGENIGGHAV